MPASGTFFEPENGKLAAEHFRNLTHSPTALVCFNDRMAIGMLKHLQQRVICIPEEISITG
jgi:LacI family transcriptional regulator